MKKEISINKGLLRKYSEQQLKDFARDNGLCAEDLAELKASLIDPNEKKAPNRKGGKH